MSVIIFIAVIVALIVVHEFGHFVAAKFTGMRVDEFGIGYPPRALTITRKGETLYTLNWLPFGGFVKIYGEDSFLDTARDARSFSSKTRLAQAFVLVAGVAMNLLFAYVLITAALVAGMPRALSDDEIVVARDTALAVARVLPGSPAERAGLSPGDSIVSATNTLGEWYSVDQRSFSVFIAESGGETVTLWLKRGGKEKKIVATPETGVATGDPTRYALGVEVATIGIVSLPFTAAIVEGVKLTWEATRLTAVGLAHFFFGVLTLSADLSQVAGPIGIVGVVGAAGAAGLGNLLSITAIISINLALINLIPVPALDGGRLLFVAIESVIRRSIKPDVARAVNAVGFVFLILLMLVVTAHDIFNIVK